MNKLAREYNYTPEQIRKIICSQYDFVVKVMKESDPLTNSFKNVLLASFGRFCVIGYAKKRIQEKSDSITHYYLIDEEEEVVNQQEQTDVTINNSE